MPTVLCPYVECSSDPAVNADEVASDLGDALWSPPVPGKTIWLTNKFDTERFINLQCDEVDGTFEIRKLDPVKEIEAFEEVHAKELAALREWYQEVRVCFGVVAYGAD